MFDTIKNKNKTTPPPPPKKKKKKKKGKERKGLSSSFAVLYSVRVLQTLMTDLAESAGNGHAEIWFKTLMTVAIIGCSLRMRHQ